VESTVSANESCSDTSGTDESIAYPLAFSPKVLQVEEARNEKTTKTNETKKMELKCKACGKAFDSTFSVEEFSLLPRQQYEAGTLHLCPACGNLSIYELKDYQEPK
jgi:hypothetical protein